MEIDDRLFKEFAEGINTKVDYTNRKVTSLDEDVKKIATRMEDMADKLGAVVLDTGIQRTELTNLRDTVRNNADREQRERDTIWREFERTRDDRTVCRQAEEGRLKDARKEIIDAIEIQIRAETRSVKLWALAAFWTGFVGVCAAAGAIIALSRSPLVK